MKKQNLVFEEKLGDLIAQRLEAGDSYDIILEALDLTAESTREAYELSQTDDA